MSETTLGSSYGRDALPGSRAPGKFLDSLLVSKKQEASLLFSTRDCEATGTVAAKHLRPILHALFPPPSVSPESPSRWQLDVCVAAVLWEDMLSTRGVRAVYEQVTRRWMRRSSATDCVFTLSELHAMMEALFYSEPAEEKRSWTAARSSVANRASLRRSPPSSIPAVLSVEMAALRVTETMASFPVEPKDARSDSTPSTGRDSSVGGHSSVNSYTTTSAGTAGVATLASTYHVLGESTGGSNPFPVQQLALLLGTLERTFSTHGGGREEGQALARPLSAAADGPPAGEMSYAEFLQLIICS